MVNPNFNNILRKALDDAENQKQKMLDLIQTQIDREVSNENDDEYWLWNDIYGIVFNKGKE